MEGSVEEVAVTEKVVSGERGALSPSKRLAGYVGDFSEGERE